MSHASKSKSFQNGSSPTSLQKNDSALHNISSRFNYHGLNEIHPLCPERLSTDNDLPSWWINRNKTLSVPMQFWSSDQSQTAEDENEVLFVRSLKWDYTLLQQSCWERRIRFSFHQAHTKTDVVLFAQKTIKGGKRSRNFKNERFFKALQPQKHDIMLRQQNLIYRHYRQKNVKSFLWLMKIKYQV